MSKTSDKKTYCLFCKKDTGNVDIRIVKKKIKNKKTGKETIRPYKMATCVICGHKKSLGRVLMQAGTGIVDKFIANLPVELHLLGTDEKNGKVKKSSFIGPGTKLDKRLGPGDVPQQFSQPINDLDRGALQHDICYRDSTDPAVRNACDDKLVAKAKAFLHKKGISALDKIDVGIVIAAMKAIKHKV